MDDSTVCGPFSHHVRKVKELLSYSFSLAGMRETILHFSMVDNLRKMQVVEACPLGTILSGDVIGLKLIFLAGLFLTIKEILMVNKYEIHSSHCLIYILPFEMYGHWQ